MITQADLDKLYAIYIQWEQTVQKEFSEYQTKSGWFSGKAGEKSEYENAVKSRDKALTNYNNMARLYNNQAGIEAQASLYESQLDDAKQDNTIYYVIAVIVALVLGYVLYRQFKK